MLDFVKPAQALGRGFSRRGQARFNKAGDWQANTGDATKAWGIDSVVDRGVVSNVGYPINLSVIGNMRDL
jgi:hypothetical protein